MEDSHWGHRNVLFWILNCDGDLPPNYNTYDMNRDKYFVLFRWPSLSAAIWWPQTIIVYSTTLPAVALLPASIGTQAQPACPPRNIICQIRFMISVSGEHLANVQFVSLQILYQPLLAQLHHLECQQVNLQIWDLQPNCKMFSCQR